MKPLNLPLSLHVGVRMRRLFCFVGLVVVAAALGCSLKDSVSDRIAAEASRSKTIDLAKLTQFSWDRVVVFGPYASSERICAALPGSWTQCASTYPQGLGEGSYLLAFVREGAVVHHELHPRANGHFCSNSCLLQLTPQEARFNVQSAAVGASGSGPNRLSQITP